MSFARTALRAVAFGSLLAIQTVPVARANTPEDLQGVGARPNAMGGAGTALSGDFTATYYNPAALTRCTDDHLSVDIRRTVYDLHVRRIGADAPPGTAKPLRDQTRISTGFCFGLPYNLAFGMSLGLGLENTMSLDVAGPNSRPQYVMYGEALEQLSIALGFAYEPIPQISLGFGGSILVNTDLSFGAQVPVGIDADSDGFSDPLQVGLRLNVLPTGAPYLGVQVRPVPEITIGITYRGPMYLNLQVPATIRASTVGGLQIPIPLQVQGYGWYTPRQFAIGVSGAITRDLTLTADVTYYNWASLGNTYYPFLAISPQEGYESSIAGSLGYPRMGPAGWRDIWVPRIGGELRVFDSRIAIRGGYSFRPSALPLPGTRTMLSNDGVTQIPNSTTLLDSGVHSVSFGLGYYFGDRPDERDAAAGGELPVTDPLVPPAAPRAAHVLPYDTDGFELEPVLASDETSFASATDERGAQSRSGTRTQPARTVPPAPTPGPNPPRSAAQAPTPTPTPASTARAPSAAGTTSGATASTSPTAAAPADPAGPADPSAADEPDSELPGITGQIDFMFRAGLMQERVDAVKDISYGGTIYDIGVQLSLGWY